MSVSTPPPVPARPGSLSAWLDGQDVQRMNRYREYLDFHAGRQWLGRRRAGETRLVFNLTVAGAGRGHPRLDGRFPCTDARS